MKINLPAWMQRSDVNLPPWAKVSPSGSKGVSIKIDIDTDGAMREWMHLLGVERVDQYWLEVAFQCAKLDVQSALAGTKYDPRINGAPPMFSFNRADKWALRRHPVGRGIEAATKGKEARQHYQRIRGALPM
jgi:hypothetical protein